MVIHDINNIYIYTNNHQDFLLVNAHFALYCTIQIHFEKQESTASAHCHPASLLPMVPWIPLLHQRHAVPMAVTAILHSAAALLSLEPKISVGSSHRRESRWWIEPCENWSCYWHSCHEPRVDSKEESCQPSLGFSCHQKLCDTIEWQWNWKKWRSSDEEARIMIDKHKHIFEMFWGLKCGLNNFWRPCVSFCKVLTDKTSWTPDHVPTILLIGYSHP